MIWRFLKWYAVIAFAELLHILLSVGGQYTSCEIVCEPFALGKSAHAVMLILALLITTIT